MQNRESVLEETNEGMLEEAKIWFESEATREELVDLCRKLAYMLLYIRRVSNRDALPESVDDPLFERMKEDALIEAYDVYGL